ncbi:MAG TPA: alpha-L-fucosidase [Acidobacteriaceae bacterium]|jgi:alpha-L-fucosidase|nr:alpha-L-fucosidase [Acidobacteriaceae bacterium]
MGSFSPINAQTQFTASSPTASDVSAHIDQIWQHANAKFDGTRAAILKQVDRQANDGPFRPDWQSLMTYQVPQWYTDAKFGIFVHWGVYSVPAFGSEWYSRNMYVQGSEDYKHQIATYGPLANFGYKDFIPMFRAEHYDPQAWAHLFKESGAKYVVQVFEHHDGFAMYDSQLSDWTAVKMGPHRDVAGDLEKAVRAEGLHFGASDHRIEHDWFMHPGREIVSDVNNPRYAAFYGPAHTHLWKHRAPLSEDWTFLSPQFANDWLARAAEIVEKYHPDMMYFDYWIGQPLVRPYLARFAAFYYNESIKRGPVGIINYKGDAMRPHSAVLDLERNELSDIQPEPWQTDTSVSNKSWGYIQDDTFKTPGFIVRELVDVVSKNGNLLLNIGPRADGTIPTEVQQILLDVGSWLNMNGDAIYGTRPWKIYGEGPTKLPESARQDIDIHPYTAEDFRFTTKGDALYAIEMAWPQTGKTVIHSLGSAFHNAKIKSVVLLDSKQSLPFQLQSDGLHIQVPIQSPGKYAYVFRIQLDNESGPGNHP